MVGLGWVLLFKKGGGMLFFLPDAAFSLSPLTFLGKTEWGGGGGGGGGLLSPPERGGFFAFSPSSLREIDVWEENGGRN